MAKMTDIRNVRRVNAEGLLHIDYTDEDGEDHTLSADAGLVYDLAESGQFGAIADYVPPPPPTQAEIDAEQDAKLDGMANYMTTGDARFKLVMTLIFEIVKTMLTNDKTFWKDPMNNTPLSSKPGWWRLVRQTIKNG